MASSERVRLVVEQLASVNPFTNAKNLPDVPRPLESSIPRGLPSMQQLPYVQNVLNMLTYNFLPQTFFCLEKHRSLHSILLTSKEILTEALPIRCLEATFVSLYLTNWMQDVDRIPLSFRSRAKGRSYHHIVLVVRCNSLYGSLGLSRKATLMDKPVIYSSLFELIMEYKKQYEAIGHKLVDCKLGLCVNHEAHSQKTPCWRYVAVNLSQTCSLLGLASPHLGIDTEACEPQECPSEGRRGDSPNHLADVAHLLGNYTALLSTISVEYDKHAVPYASAPGSRKQPTCLKDLHEMEEEVAREENKRRLEKIRSGRSPCVSSYIAPKKRAASRSVSKRRGKCITATCISLEPRGKKRRPVVAKGLAKTENVTASSNTNSEDGEDYHLPSVARRTPAASLAVSTDVAVDRLCADWTTDEAAEGNSATQSPYRMSLFPALERADEAGTSIGLSGEC